MRHLLLKDLLLQRWLAIFLPLSAILFAFIWRSADGYFFGGMFGYILVSSIVAHDGINSANILLNSLPIPKWKIVASKYLSLFLYGSIFMGIFLVFDLLLLGNTTNLEQHAIRTFSMFIIGILYWPAYFNFGFSKARYWNFFVFIGFLFAFPALYSMLVASSLPTYLGMATLLAIITVGSFGFSLKLYAQREF